MQDPVVVWASGLLDAPPAGSNKVRCRTFDGSSSVGGPTTVPLPLSDSDRRRVLARVTRATGGQSVRIEWLDGSGAYMTGQSTTIEESTELDASPLARLEGQKLEAVIDDRMAARVVQLSLARDTEDTKRHQAELDAHVANVKSMGALVDKLAGHVVKLSGVNEAHLSMLDRVADLERQKAEAIAEATMAEAGQDGGTDWGQVRGAIGDVRDMMSLKSGAQNGALLARIVSRLADGHGVKSLRAAVLELSPDKRRALQGHILGAFA